VTLCVSAVFVVVRCMSVRPSLSCIVSRRLKIAWNFFLGPVAPFIFWPRVTVRNSSWTPSVGAQYTPGVEKICDFRLKSPFISEIAWLLRNVNSVNNVSHRWRIDRYRFWWPWVTLKGGTRGVKFRRISLITIVLFDIEWPNSAE